MKHFLIMTILTVFFVSTSGLVNRAQAVETAESHRLVGKFKKAQSQYQKIAPEGLFFVILNQEGEALAFPVTFKNSKMRAKVLSSIDKTYTVEGERAELAVVDDSAESAQRVYVLKLKSVEEAKLSELRPKISAVSATGSAGKAMDKPARIGETVPRSPTLSGVNDSATNAVIFTAGAILLGSILSN